jgi:serine/threonine protein phosphatase PrpC
VVADGLGGHAAGEVASALAIESICATVGNHKEQHEPVALLDLAFAEADQVAREHAHSKPECAGMGATLIVAMIRGDELFLAHVGDVRAYHRRDGNLTRLTQDHTAVGRLLRDGLIEEDAARHHPARNQVDQAIGGARAVIPEHVQMTLAPGDRVLLCSDGLWDEVPHADIAAVLADSTPAFHLANRLVDKAIAAGGHDNITAVVYRHCDGSEAKQ